MLSRRVSLRAPFDQPIFSHALEAQGTGLSLWLALRFCIDLWPNEARLALAVGALTWEGARLYLTPLAFAPLTDRAGCNSRAGAAALLAMVAILTAGSVAASAASLERAEMRDQERIRISSPLYLDAVAQREAADAQLRNAIAVSSGYIAREMLSKARDMGPQIEELRKERARAALAEDRLRNGFSATQSGHASATLSQPNAASAPDAAGAPGANTGALDAASGQDAAGATDATAGGHLRPDASDAPGASRVPDANAGAMPTWKKIVHLVVILAFKLIAPVVRITSRVRCATAWQAHGYKTPSTLAQAPIPASATPRPAVPEASASANDDEYEQKCAEAKTAILKREVSPTTRGIQHAAGVGQARALKIQADLLVQGVIKREGRTYVLVVARDVAA